MNHKKIIETLDKGESVEIFPADVPGLNEWPHKLGSYLMGDLEDWVDSRDAHAGDYAVVGRISGAAGWSGYAVYRCKEGGAYGYYVGGDCPLVGRECEEIPGLAKALESSDVAAIRAALEQGEVI